jgi:hypothetical protein
MNTVVRIRDMSSMKLPADGNYLIREYPLFLPGPVVFTTGPFFPHEVQHPPRIHPGPGQSRRDAVPANPDTAVIAGKEDLRAPAGNDEVNQDQGFGADDKGADTCEDIKIPP